MSKIVDTEICPWSHDIIGAFATACGNYFQFNEGGPVYNGFHYCPYCGKQLVEVPYEEDDDDTTT